MELIIAFLVGGVIGFVGGFLVFRNNQAKMNALEAKAKEVAGEVKDI